MGHHAARQRQRVGGRLLRRSRLVDHNVAERPGQVHVGGVGGECVVGLGVVGNERHVVVLDALEQAQLRLDHLAGQPREVISPQALGAFHAQVAPLVADVGRRRAHELLQLLIRRCNLGEHYDDGTPAGRNRLDNLVELRELAQDYERYAPAKALERMLTDIALTSGADDTDPRERVTLITLHMAKGLEYPVVFLTGLEDKMLPHERAFEEPGGLEEERRLCYVGITRAQRRLYLTVANARTIFAKTVALASSQFLLDIPGQLLDLVELEGHRAHVVAARVRKGSIEASA